ncbi:probable E3 ubiquitin-protein ligase RHB1A [Rutidosis leptorrhynchoides]|uniref:probable E3 ubiquitin-protein ligase RHB1A n=1 Tax=Rutidosis leptorrhynchoides TaxID=125765 RepID=UPI003A9995CA
MGGCCCCFSSNRVELNSSPRFYHHYPIASEERQPLSSNSNATSAFSTGLLVDTNLETSIPDTYRPPPAPIPYDVGGGTSLNNQQTNNIVSVEEISISSNNNEIVTKEAKGSECKEITNIELVETNETENDIEKSDILKKPSGPILPPEECPTCFEEYDEDNPKIITKCEHHFHLSCILEWMERSDTCPVCDQEMIINFPVNE